MQVTKNTEVRTTNNIVITPQQHFFFGGTGRKRKNLNDGQPTVLNAYRGRQVSGQVTGLVKVTPIKGANDWFSIRSIKGDGRTHYLKGDTLVVLDGYSYLLRALYHNA